MCLGFLCKFWFDEVRLRQVRSEVPHALDAAGTAKIDVHEDDVGLRGGQQGPGGRGIGTNRAAGEARLAEHAGRYGHVAAALTAAALASNIMGTRIILLHSHVMSID
mgnify:CR=1 FL=1